MTPIEQVRPALPGNWTRKPDGRIKPGAAGEHKQRNPAEKKRSGRNPGDDPDEREHIVDELA